MAFSKPSPPSQIFSYTRSGWLQSFFKFVMALSAVIVFGFLSPEIEMWARIFPIASLANSIETHPKANSFADSRTRGNSYKVPFEFRSSLRKSPSRISPANTLWEFDLCVWSSTDSQCLSVLLSLRLPVFVLRLSNQRLGHVKLHSRIDAWTPANEHKLQSLKPT